jgi:hypothetical protein
VLLFLDNRNIRKDIKELLEMHKYKRFLEDLNEKIEIEKNNAIRTSSSNKYNVELNYIVNNTIKHYFSIFNTILNKDFDCNSDKLFQIYTNEFDSLFRTIKLEELYLKNPIEFSKELKLIIIKNYQIFAIDIDRIRIYKNGNRRSLFSDICRKLVSKTTIDILSIYEKY